MSSGRLAEGSSDVSQAYGRVGRGLGPGRAAKSGTRPGRGVIPAGTWVELECVILPAGERAPGIPADTGSVPFAGRVRGFLVADAEEGAVARVRTQADRVVTGRLRVVLPRNPADFGSPSPELLAVASEVRARFQQSRAS
jgi:2-amino-4-ketopentanoate thiolase subunit OrtA